VRKQVPGLELGGSRGGLASADAAPFTVLAVCTGNICRSPAVELWLRAALGPEQDSGVRVASAGVRAVVGSAMCPDMARLVELGGLSPAGFRARQLTEPMVREAGLVLALSRGHRSLIVEATPAALRRTFTLREFARLVGLVDRADLEAALGGPEVSASVSPGQRLAALVPLTAQRRGQVRVPAEDDDVVDPIGQASAVSEQAADHIWRAVQTIARAARGRGRPAHATPAEATTATRARSSQNRE